MAHRAAVVGCGIIGGGIAVDPRTNMVNSHAGAYAASALTTLVGVCDIDADRVASCGRRWKVAQYRDCREMLAELEPSIVSVCTPDATHFDVLREVLAAPSVRGVLAEKPLTLDVSEAEEISRLADERGIRLAVNYVRRYSTSHQRLKAFLESDGVGDVQTVAGFYTKGALHNGTHWFDLARFLVGEIVRVWGRDVLGESGEDPTLDAFMEFDRGAAAHLMACRSTAFTVFEMDIVGTRGRVRVTDSGHEFSVFEVIDSPRDPGHRSLKATNGLSGSLEDVVLRAVENLADAIDNGVQPLCTAADGIAALKVAQAVRESAKTGAVVEIPNP